MDTDGYRDHSAARRDQTFAKLNFRPDADSRLALIYSSLEQNDTEDPLGQTWDAYKHDPRSVTANAELYDTRKSIDHQQAGMNYERYFGEATLQVNAYVGKRSVVQYLSIPKGWSPTVSVAAAWWTSTATSTAAPCAGCNRYARRRAS